MITVLKFGGSVLRDESDLPHAVHEIYRHWRRGSQVVAVVSAFNGKTDKLLAKTLPFGDDAHVESVASLLLTGETESASLLCMELDRSGIRAKFLTAHQLNLLTKGERLDAEPVSVDAERLRNELSSSVVVVSGFGGIDECGTSTLLGRGGSDLTALFLAERLDARCILIKDTDGLFEYDPNAAKIKPRRFESADYSTAITIGGGVVQEKAIRFAERNALTIEIGALNSASGTKVGDFADSFAENAEDRRPTRIALLGCGVVGGGAFAKLSALPNDFEIVGVTNLHREKAIANRVPGRLIVNDADELLSRDADVVVELIGGIEPARTFIEKALRSGKNVVTANKALIAKHGEQLYEIAKNNGVSLRFSAAVGGVMPALESVAAVRECSSVSRISGIVNGTCNFICDELAKGIDFDTALLAAQQKGFAEADPTLDIDGSDAAQKLILLAREAFDVDLPFESIKRIGIQNIDPEQVQNAKQRGNSIKLVAECKRMTDGLYASVCPIEVLAEHPFAAIRGADNCLLIESIDGQKAIVRGKGAGRYPTTEAVIADLFDIRNQTAAKEKAFAAKVKI